MASAAKRRIVIIGGSGFIGTNLVSFFAAAGCDVLSVDVARPRNPDHAPLWRLLDVLDSKMLQSTLQQFAPDVVLHAAARTDLNGRSVSAYEANTRGVENVIRAITSTPSIDRVIFFSSRLVCRIGYRPSSDTDYCPNTMYGASKVVGEQSVRAAQLDVPWLIVRPTSIWGPWFDIPYRTFFDLIQRGRFFRIDGARVLKSFGFVGNTVYEIDRLLTAPAEAVAGRTFYLADYPPVDVGEWADCIQRAMSAPPIRAAPRRILQAGAFAGDLLKRVGWSRVPITTFRLDNLLTPMVHDLRPLEEIVGPLPYSVEEGVAATVEWMLLNNSAFRRAA
jgi:nucleoside-diphosphate-sugar epimerase